ncbi:MAG: MOSC domain-containing protein [Alphaproteobacteria bacterium]|nr:MOSC domain-containing protein [Alphaproteobacteria bacterium]
MRVASLHTYPIKGVRAVDVARAHVEPRGLEGDRRWLVVDANGRFITQRSHPRLATITAAPTRTGLRLSAPGAGEFLVERPSAPQRADVIVWQHQINAALADVQAGAWLSNYFGEALRLAYMDAVAERLQRNAWVADAVPVSFADAYPVLIVTTASLAAVNGEIERAGGAQVSMRRFRPNIVIDCGDAWAEDFWRVVRIGGVEFELVKPCDRCVVTTKDQETGASMGKEPLASLARLRRSADARINGVLFGWNAVPRALGRVAVGDAVEVLERRPEGFALRSDLPHGFEVEHFLP